VGIYYSLQIIIRFLLNPLPLILIRLVTVSSQSKKKSIKVYPVP